MRITRWRRGPAARSRAPVGLKLTRCSAHERAGWRASITSCVGAAVYMDDELRRRVHESNRAALASWAGLSDERRARVAQLWAAFAEGDASREVTGDALAGPILLSD